MKKWILGAALVVNSISTVQAGKRAGDVYGVGGTGQTSHGESIGYKGGQAGINYKVGEKEDLGVFYMNEGTPANNHRDGFGMVGWYRQPINDDLTIAVGAGPYISMNTTTVENLQLNDKNIGAMAALAVLYRIHGTNFHLRAQYMRTQVPGQMNTNTLFVGAGWNFENSMNSRIEDNIRWSLWGGNSKTTRGSTEMSRGFQVEVKKMQGQHLAYSVSVIYEGNSGVSERTGIAGQVWYVTKAPQGWEFSVGVGPYIARDKADGSTRLLAATSMRVDKEIAKTVYVGFTFNRMISRNQKDQDMFLIGVTKKF